MDPNGLSESVELASLRRSENSSKTTETTEWTSVSRSGLSSTELRGVNASDQSITFISCLFGRSIAKFDGMMILDWMKNVMDYCQEKSSQITNPVEREKYCYAKASLD